MYNIVYISDSSLYYVYTILSSFESKIPVVNVNDVPHNTKKKLFAATYS